MLDWRLTLYLKVEPVAHFNLHHYMGVAADSAEDDRDSGQFGRIKQKSWILYPFFFDKTGVQNLIYTSKYAQLS